MLFGERVRGRESLNRSLRFIRARHRTLIPKISSTKAQRLLGYRSSATRTTINYLHPLPKKFLSLLSGKGVCFGA